MTSLLDWANLPRKSSMRKVPTPSGRFAFQLYFDDVGEIDEICLEALKTQSLLAPTPTPVRIERFVEKQFRTTVRYEDLGPDNLGCTIFNPWNNRTRLQPAGEFDQLLLTRRVTDFCTDRSLSAITFLIVEKTNAEYCADRKTFSWRHRAPTEGDGGNSKQTKRLGVSCFPDRL
jgi:hypothetical protein